MHIDTVNLEHVKAILELFGSLFSKLGHNLNIARGERTKILFSGCMWKTYGVLLTLNISRSFWCHLVHFY